MEKLMGDWLIPVFKLHAIVYRPYGGGAQKHHLIEFRDEILRLAITRLVYFNAADLPSHALVETICRLEFSG